MTEFIDQTLVTFAAINDGKRHRIETAKYKRQLTIMKTIFAIGVGTAIFFAIPATIPAATAFLETTLATFLPGVTAAELSTGITGVFSAFGPNLIRMITSFVQ